MELQSCWIVHFDWEVFNTTVFYLEGVQIRLFGYSAVNTEILFDDQNIIIRKKSIFICAVSSGGCKSSEVVSIALWIVA